MPNYAQHVSTKKTSQSLPVPGKDMVQNSAGGHVFKLDKWARLKRFLVLGCDGGTYYATEQKLTVENASCIAECLSENITRTINTIVEVSEKGLAPKNDAAVFALAICASFQPATTARQLALANLSKVCRIGTHLFQFNEAVKQLRGRGRALKTAIGRWYTEKSGKDLAYQACKYQQRNGWSHRDLLRLSKPRCVKGSSHQEIFHWITKGWESVGELPHPNVDLQLIWAFERAKKADAKEACRLIREYDLPRECVRTELLNEVSVWEALLEKMPLTTLVRNLGKMTKVGLLAPLSAGVKKAVSDLENGERLKKSRLHPVSVLGAMLQYKAGHGDKGSLTWTPISQIVDALDGAFYRAFGNVEPTGKNWLLALDVSGSMGSGTIAGFPNLTPRVGSAAMALVTANVEKSHHFVGFTSNGLFSRPCMHQGWASGISPLAISPKQRIDDVCRYVQGLPMGGTDCALPMVYASELKIPVDAFVVYTDSETWAGNIHPFQALEQYRQKMGRDAKLIVVGMTATNFTIANPDDPGMMDVCGFSTDTPQAMSSFASGWSG